MKVDLVCGSYPPEVCGVADYTRHLARKLRARGVDAQIVTTCGRDVGSSPDIPAVGLASGWTISGARRLARSLSERGADIVHIQFPTKPYHGHLGVHVLPLFLKSAAPRTITTLHEYCMAPWGGRLKQLLNVWFSDRVFVTSGQDRALLSRWTSDRRIRTIPIGSNIEPVGTADEGHAILESLGAPPGARVLVYFGFVRPGKGVEAALRGLACAPEDAVMVIVSAAPAPDYRARLDALASELGVEQRLFWSGYRDERDVSCIMRASFAAVLPFEDGATFRRGTLLAALSHGLPVITTRSVATPPALRHGVNVLMADSRDNDGPGLLLRELFSSPDLAARLSAGAAQLGEQFSWEAIAAQTIEAYNELAERRVP